jgi:RND family efflux transporter MFP subunit
MKALISKWSRVAALAGVVIIVAAAVTIAYVMHGNRQTTPSDGAEAAIPPDVPTVAVVPARRRDLSQSTTLTSELIPYESVKLYAKEAGYLQSINVDYGSRVRAGETLATLELPEQQADLEKSDAAYGLAKVDYERVARVNEQDPGLIAQADIDKAKADYLMAQDQRDRASVVEGYSVITAPFDGVVTKRYVDDGALIAQGTTNQSAMPIVEVADTYRLRLVLETPESIVPLIHVGLPVSVHISATGETIESHVARFSYDLHEDTRTMHTEVDIENPDLHIKPGMYASATIVVAAKPDVLAVPTQAVSTEGTPSVWIVDGDDKLEQRTVSVGLQTANYVEVTRGLQPGDLVFVGNRSAYSVGAKVKPKIASSARA